MGQGSHCACVFAHMCVCTKSYFRAWSVKDVKEATCSSGVESSIGFAEPEPLLHSGGFQAWEEWGVGGWGSPGGRCCFFRLPRHMFSNSGHALQHPGH